MIRLVMGVVAVVMHNLAYAGFGGMGNVESDGGSSGPIGPISPVAIISMLVGAFIGYKIERAINAADLRELGAKDTSDFDLGGKVGAAIGAIALPILVSFFN